MLPEEIKSTRAQITLSVIGFLALFTFIIFMLVNWTVFWSKSSVNVTKSLKWISFVACASALIMVIIDGLIILLTLDGLDEGESVLINFAAPFSAFILKLFVYFIFVGQMYALKNTDHVYRTSKIVIIFVCVLLIISVVCVLLIIILEPMIAANVHNVDLIRNIYFWDIVALNINEFILSISVILIFMRKLTFAMRSDKLSKLNKSNVKFVDEEELSYNHIASLSGDKAVENEYAYVKTGSKTKKTNPVHIMVRLFLLSTFCILWVELLFITLLIRRWVNVKYDTKAFEVARCVEAFCATMASLCIYLHFAANFKIYNCLCSCCHNCCLGVCVKCVKTKDNRNPTDDLELDNGYKEMGFMNL